ncbi:tape measure protein [Pseudomonas aeruginosa]|uniref:tape measure protein n=2 Tax=Pseudomonas TaxID=286 RepID=UPI001A280EEE|nr:tape measure protein [Pseudomonas aeruginosa]MBI6969203.1 tape measure protein [Pseudomonas aeruginosa]MBV5917963.1 tape measure protein [Pseudomonas aeruginosa]HBO0852290.1 tape measure protein [Pseudomonas aeruginosa]HBO0931182.1 tape measure protein [Pseudomonas aeruginosa]HBO1430024.1 tape measure protein [Pseudomonas aeruginosa]
MANNRAQILITAVDETRRAFQSINGSLSQLRDQAGQVGAVLSRIGGAIGVGLGVRELVEVADQYKNLQARLKLAVTTQEEFNRADAALFEIAQRNRAPLAETVTLYARLAPSVQALGRSQADVLAATDAIGQAVSLSGASSEAAAGALLQLGQAFASGQLRGEEFNSVIEQTPRLAQAIADGMGVPLGSLRALAQEGKITSAAVLDALLKERTRLAEEYASLPDTVSGALTRLKNAFQRAFGERDANSGLTAGLAQALQLVAQHLELLIDLAGVVLVAAFGRMAGAFATSIAAARAEAAARLANLRTLEAEALARVRVADTALAQARAQGLATSALVADAAKARLQATAATNAVTQAVASTSLLGRAAGLLRGALALLGGPIGVIVTTATLLAGALYSARNAVVEFGGKTASIKQIVGATWDLVVEKVGEVVGALGRLVGANDLSWARVREVMVGAIKTIGTTIRTMINGVIGAFNAVGSVAGITAAFLVERFRNAFSDIGELAQALGQDVAAAFSGDFSMSSLRAALGRRLGEMRDFGKELAGTVRDAVTRDYVGEAAQAIAGRIRPEKTQPGVFGRPQPPAKPTPDKGVEAANLALVQAHAEAELKILKDALERQARTLDAALEDRLISLKDYYAAKTRIEQQEIDAEIRRAQVALAEQQRLVKAGKDEPARLKAKAEIAKLEADLTVLNNKRADVEVANARKAVQAERELREELAKVRDELLDLTGAATSQDRSAAIARQYQSLIERLRAEGDTDGVATVGRLIDVKAAQADLAALEAQWRQVTERLRNAQEAIQTQQQAGLLSESQARQQIVALQQQSAIEMERLLPTMQQAAQAIGPEAVIRVQAWRNELARTKLVVDEMAPLWNRIGESFGGALNGMLTGAQTWRAAMSGLFQQVADAFLQQIVIQPFQQWIAMQARMLALKLGFIQQEQVADAAASSVKVAQKSAETTAVVSMDAAKAGAGAAASQASIPYVGPVLAVAAMAAMVAAVMALLGGVKKFASGGLVSGPGTSTSDSIPARLSHGEYVVNARAVSRLGVSFLDAINGLSAGPRFSGGRLAFAAGGLVPEASAQPATNQNIRIVNVIDPAMAADYLNSSAGERVVMNLIQRNAASVRNILGR